MNFNAVMFFFMVLVEFREAKDVNIKDNVGLSEHTMVTDNKIFPYVAAIMKKSQYLSAGALIDDIWVITAADSLFFLRETTRVLRVRLGSNNNRKGGTLIPVQFFEIHPFFDDKKPDYDIALIRLARSVWYSSSVYPIRLQKRPRKVSATHFIITSWPSPQSADEPKVLESMEMIQRRRMLTVSHLHPSNPDNCSEQLDRMDIASSVTVMCLDTAVGSDSCKRDTGAPVVLNGILWGLVSSWKPEDCDTEPASTLVTLVSALNISSWIHAITHGHHWNHKQTNYISYDYEYYDNDDY